MAKKAQYALIFAFGILLYFLFYQSQIVFKNTIPLLIILGAGLYYNDKLKMKKNGNIFLFLLLVILSGSVIFRDSHNITYLTASPTVDGINLALITFVFHNYLIYE
ncbi:Uncharacterised protein [Anaerococcus octavius]|uniref:Uncharacterized protein n=1 Tax=Anaerococcus octavius TaxID=54007 RepID=A0A380WS64_9FIRM|nr:hypothetical protein [Anaerococcus octavius]SUU91808.1 Uncharacterised protein [Anaerococcus octavius]